MCVGGSPDVTVNQVTQQVDPAKVTAPIALQDPLSDQATIAQDARVTALQMQGKANRAAKPQQLLVNSGAGVTDSLPKQRRAAALY
ncbi:MAG: hypothetical protein HYX63_01535 [Gammaproteobacteria bacterium]|nr:hypothetical protein [Gammaproteobacteria bacterium]